MKITKLDRKIINILLNNSRLSYRQIAKILKVSPATVMKHVNDLEDNKIIRRYTTDISFYKLGYEFKALIQLRISKGKLFEVQKKIAKDPHVYAVYDITGDFDAVLVTRFKTRNSLDKFLKHIQTYDFVERTKTSLILNVMKEKQDKIE
ncbi:winged helix-turn-helix transcriptional regulator [Candidatus Woesearchaeota archaeon]|nr:winged helix-turn-helix transcriptional regulator [Candidatus Woesearchaeota archaeon]